MTTHMGLSFPRAGEAEAGNYQLDMGRTEEEASERQGLEGGEQTHLTAMYEG